MSATTNQFIPLEDIRIASPCNASWEKMQGNDRVRFCQSCTKNVYNLSDMSKAQAEALIREKEGKLCVRFFQRADGTILTDNCPIGLRIVRKPLKWAVSAMAMVIAPIFTFGAVMAGAKAGDNARQANPYAASATPLDRLRCVQPLKTVIDWVDPAAPGSTAVAGGISAPPPLMGKPAPPIMGAPEPPPTSDGKKG